MTERTKRPRHGMKQLRQKIAIRGLNAISRRTGAARALFAWKADLIRDLGGEQALSAQQLVLIDMITRTKMFIDHADAYLMSLESLIIRRRKTFVPLVRERQALVDSLARLIAQVGLDRVPIEANAIAPDAFQRAREEIKKLAMKKEDDDGDDEPKAAD